MVDEFAPPKFFASVRGMELDQLFTEFNVGVARQMSLSAEVRICAEYNVKERRRLKSVVEKQDELLKAKDGKIENLNVQLLLKETEDAKELNALDVKVIDLKALVVGKEHFNFALQEFLEVEFPLLAELKSHKDASMKDIMNVVRLEGALADAPRMNDLHSNIELLKVPIHISEDQVVLGETSLSFALSVSHSRVERIKENITTQRSALVGVWTPLSEPLSVTCLMGEASTSGVVPAASVTTTALSTTFASASSIPPISTDDYKIVGVDGQEGAGTDG
nr:hypothetical protein [Tanacetum cinerariifolium]